METRGDRGQGQCPDVVHVKEEPEHPPPLNCGMKPPGDSRQGQEVGLVKEEPPEHSPQLGGVRTLNVHIKEETKETSLVHDMKEEVLCVDEGELQSSGSHGVSAAAMLAALYTDHTVKDELLLGPELLHRPSVTQSEMASGGASTAAAMEIPEDEAGTSDETSRRQLLKRSILVNPVDPEEEIIDSKRPKIALNNDKKISCLLAIIKGYLLVLAKVEKLLNDNKSSLKTNVSLGNNIMSILFACHNISRHKANQEYTNLIRKSKETDFKVMVSGKEVILAREETLSAWVKTAKEQGLEYKKVDPTKSENWYGTMGPYMNFFGGFTLRVNELRLGHANVPITAEDGNIKLLPVSKFGLDGAHHILLEGCTFPPERRSSMVQSLGPLTAFLCMLRTEGKFRNKYESVVKRCMSHVPYIDDIIRLTKNTRKASDIRIVTRLIADILLITTARQATRMFFPINMFVVAYEMMEDTKKEEFLSFYSTTGAGGFYVYKKLEGIKFTYRTQMTSEMVAQVAFHAIFGTYKEDLGILGEITRVTNWFSREEMGKKFQNATTEGKDTSFTLPGLIYYSQMAYANHTGLLTGVSNQVTTHSCFSGKRVHTFNEDFFKHLDRRNNYASTANSLYQIIFTLCSTREDLLLKLRSQNNKLDIRTTHWRKMEDLGLNNPGTETDHVFRTSGKTCMGPKKYES